MQVVAEPREFQSVCEARRAAGGKLSMVPTMGALHDGHLSLVDLARQVADTVVVTIFVNPTQFGPNEDFERYPRALEADLKACRARDVDVVFTPQRTAMYAPHDHTRVRVGELDRFLCGASRPTHFKGVCTVVSKLFALAGRCAAVFGRKDYQQLQIIKRLARDLFFPVDIIEAPIRRDADGLALSSRNVRLGSEARAKAVGLVRGLERAQRSFERGEGSAEALTGIVRSAVEQHGLALDYATLMDADELVPLDEAGTRALLAVAAFAGDTRLIDNVVLGEDPELRYE